MPRSVLDNLAFRGKNGGGKAGAKIKQLLKKQRPTIGDVLGRWKTHEHFKAEGHGNAKRQWTSMIRRLKMDKRPAAQAFHKQHYSTQGGLKDFLKGPGAAAGEGGVEAGVEAGAGEEGVALGLINAANWIDNAIGNRNPGLDQGGGFLDYIGTVLRAGDRVDNRDNNNDNRGQVNRGMDEKAPLIRHWGSNDPSDDEDSDEDEDDGFSDVPLIDDPDPLPRRRPGRVPIGGAISVGTAIAAGGALAAAGAYGNEDTTIKATGHTKFRKRPGKGKPLTPKKPGGPTMGDDYLQPVDTGDGCPTDYHHTKRRKRGLPRLKKQTMSAGIRPSAHHAPHPDLPTGPSSNEVGGDEGHGHNPHAPGPHMGGNIQRQQAANTAMYEEHMHKGASTAHGEGNDYVAEESGEPTDPNREGRQGGKKEGTQWQGPGTRKPDRGPNIRWGWEGPAVTAPDRPPPREATNTGGYRPRRNRTMPKYHEETPNEVREDLHFRSMLPEIREDALTRPVGSSQAHKEQFILFDYHQRDNEFASLGSQLEDDFYQQRLREKAIRYKSPLNKFPLEFKGSHTGLRQGDAFLGGYGSQPRGWSADQYEKELFVEQNQPLINEIATSVMKHQVVHLDNEFEWGAIHDGTYFPRPLQGIMHDQVRENINFGKNQMIATGPIAPIDSYNNFDKPIMNQFERSIYNHPNRCPWDTLTTEGTYPWVVGRN